MTEWESDQLIFINKNAANEWTADWKYEWLFRDFLCHVRRSCKKSCCWSILSVINLDDYLAVNVYQKSYNAARFNEFIHLHVFSKCKSEYNILIMNNCSTHWSWELKRLCRKADIKLAFLSSYSSDYNLIEQSFHVLKEWMQRHQDLARSQYRNDYEEFVWLTVRSFMKEKNAHEYFRFSNIEDSEEN